MSGSLPVNLERVSYIEKDLNSSRRSRKTTELYFWVNKLLENLEDGNHANFWRKFNREWSAGSESSRCLRIGEANLESEILTLWREHQ